MDILHYYKKAVVLPGLIVLVSTVINLMISTDNEYESEWMTNDGIFLASMSLSFIYVLFFSVISLPLLLNQWEKIANNKLYSALAWFLLPSCFVATIFYHEIAHSLSYGYADFGLVFTAFITFPYLIALFFSYYKFCKANYKKQSCLS